MRLKENIKPWIPPIFFDIRHSLINSFRGNTPEWEYMSNGWKDGSNNPRVKGWDTVSVANALEKQWPEFIKKLEGQKPFGNSNEAGENTKEDLSFHNTIMVFAYSISLAARKHDEISMLDWGGGIGHYYLIAKQLLPDVNIDYTCKELRHLAELGQKLLPEASFSSSDTCLEKSYDFILASGAVHYIEDWKNVVKQLATATKGYLLINRLPITETSSSYVFIQRPYAYGYKTEYLGWCISIDEFRRFARQVGLVLMREFIIGEQPPIKNAPGICKYRGFLFKKNNTINNDESS